MIFIIILLSVSFILDFILFNFISFSFNNISFLFPMLFLITNIYLFKYINKKNFYIYLLFIILYSSTFLNNIILGIVLFSSIYFINKLILYFPIYIRVLLLIFIYDLIFYLILIVFSNYQLSISFYLYKVIRSILVNIIYLFFLNLVLKKKDA